MDRPTPDGKLRILQIDYSSRPEPGGMYWEVVPFSDQPGSTDFRHKDSGTGLMLCWKEHRRLIPWIHILEVDIIYNSKEYLDQMDGWWELEHQQHIIDELEVEECKFCVFGKFVAGMENMGMQVIQMPQDASTITDAGNDPYLRRRPEDM